MTKKAPLGCKDLKERWWSSTLADIKRLSLPDPDHDYGFSTKLLKNNLSAKEFKELAAWMYGQTCMIDEKLGTINYTHDIIRGLDYIRHGKPTYWD